MKLYELFIDELGQSNPLSLQSNVYILCGCVIENSHREFVRTRADQIKFKKPRIAREKKMKFYETIDPFCIIPRK